MWEINLQKMVGIFLDKFRKLNMNGTVANGLNPPVLKQ